MGDPSVIPLPALDAHGSFSAASLPDMRRAIEDAQLEVLQFDLEVKRIYARGGDPTIAVDLVAQLTARIEGLRREASAARRALAGRG